MYLSTSEPRPHDTPCRRDSHSTWLLSWLALLLQGRCYDVLHWRHFPAAIVSVVLLNTAFQVHKEPQVFSDCQVVFRVNFSGICTYCAEQASHRSPGASGSFVLSPTLLCLCPDDHLGR